MRRSDLGLAVRHCWAAAPNSMPNFTRTFSPSLEELPELPSSGEAGPMSFLSYESPGVAKAIKAAVADQEDAAVVCRSQVRPFRE